MTTPNPNAVKEKMEQLAACPFCDSVAIEIVICTGGNFYCQCLSCSMEQAVSGSRQLAINFWNTRAPSPDLTALRQQNKELVELLKDVLHCDEYAAVPTDVSPEFRAILDRVQSALSKLKP